MKLPSLIAGIVAAAIALPASAEFLDVASYEHVVRWATEIEARPAVQRGRRVNRAWGPEEERVVERHSASDFDVG